MTKRLLLMICISIVGSVLLNNESVYSQVPSVSDVSYSMRDSDVVVHYNLNGPADRSYTVAVVLRRESEPYFQMHPKSVTGDVGADAHSGKNKEIVWHLYRDAPDGLDGDDYFFEVNATLLAVESGGASWLYYVGGALVAGGAAVYFGTDLIKKPAGASQFPAPPLRP